MLKRKRQADEEVMREEEEEEERASSSRGGKGKGVKGGAKTSAASSSSSSSLSSAVVPPPTLAMSKSAGMYTNKQRVLVLSSRGITARYRHLLEDLKQLIPHHKKDNKLDSKGEIQVVNEIAEMKSCNQVIYLETRKHQDLYMYMGKTPHGPSVKFHVVNIHTMDELKLTGNCMLGSRPILNFDKKFNTSAHWKLLQALLTDAFGTPRGHPKSKPFVDRIMSFFIVKGNIWVRNYQIMDKGEREDKKDTHLVEIGPRMVLIPIRIFSGSLGGATLYQNPAFVSPNEERSAFKRRKGERFTERAAHKAAKKEMSEERKDLLVDELSNKRVFGLGGGK